MAEFTYNNTKNSRISYKSFELNCNYHFCIFYKENIDFYYKSKPTDNLAYNLTEFIVIY